MDEIVPLFEEKTGLDVELRNGKDLELANQLVAEGDDSPADVFLTENSPAMSIVDNAGPVRAGLRTTALAPIPDAVRPELAAAGPASWPARRSRCTTPTRCTEADLPESILDFADPEWKGRVGFSPTGADFQAIVSAVLEPRARRRPRAWLEGLAENGTRLRQQPGRDAERQRGRGRRRHHLPLLLVPRPGRVRRRTQRLDRAPLLRRPGPRAPSSASPAPACSPAASTRSDAQKFVEFLTSTEGQQALADSYALEYPLNPRPTLDPRGQAVRRARAAGRRPLRPQRTARSPS